MCDHSTIHKGDNKLKQNYQGIANDTDVYNENKGVRLSKQDSEILHEGMNPVVCGAVAVSKVQLGSLSLATMCLCWLQVHPGPVCVG